ncbi:MAG: class I SAM-dependent methyltransferase [Rhodomicrobium sp.]
MQNRLAAYAHLATQTLRTGYYAALYRISQNRAASMGAEAGGVKITRPVPSLRELLQDVLKLQARDAKNIRDGLYPIPIEEGGSLADHIQSLRAMFEDLPQSAQRRAERNADEAASLPEAKGLPAYYTQNFHYQSGGYLTAESAKVYDLQVETLFMGAAAAMRRQAIPPIAKFTRGRDQRALNVLDVACGSGRFLHQLAQAFPAMPLTGTDLSQAYLDEASRYLEGRRNISLQQANAEALPFVDGSFDIVTCVFLYHELPNEIRHYVTSEIARVLKPGGLFVFVDSLQWGDASAYDGLLEAFPQRFHEPYYLDYLHDKLEGPEGKFASADLITVEAFPAFLSKVIVCRKALTANESGERRPACAETPSRETM